MQGKNEFFDKFSPKCVKKNEKQKKTIAFSKGCAV